MSIKIFTINSDGFSMLIAYGYYVKDIRVIVGGGSLSRDYFFVAIKREQNYVKGSLTIYHVNLKGESFLLICAHGEEGELMRRVPIVYLHIVVENLSVNPDETIIQGRVYTENYTVSSAVINILLPNGKISSVQTDAFGCFSITVPYASSYVVKAHGGYVVDSTGSVVDDVIICSTFEVVKLIAP